ncbi:MAG: GDSL-type esterase/lipase family protein, partial [Frankiaceae bacterium]|nr:GDSL-type esterase/lipase family protein [Frankiaceae bacterium]
MTRTAAAVSIGALVVGGIIAIGLSSGAQAATPVANAVNVVVPYGQVTGLPDTVVIANNGSPESHPVSWPALDQAIFTQPGKHTVTGRTADTGQNVTGIVNVQPQGSPVKVAAVGDSITFGAGTSNFNTKSFPAQVQAMVGSGYQVTDYGVSGTTLMTKGGAPYINTGQYTQSHSANPDVVLLQLGTNDALPGNFLQIATFAADYQAMVQSYLSLPSHPVVYAELPPTIQSSNMGGYNDPNLRDIIGRTLGALSDPAFAGVSIIDNHTLTRDAAAFYPDTVHPSDAGAMQLAVNVRLSLTGDAHQPHAGKTQVTALTDQRGTYLDDSNDQSGLMLRGIAPGGWFCFANVTLAGDSPRVALRVRAPYDSTTLTVRADSPTGPTVGSAALSASGNWATAQVAVDGVSGPRDLCFSFDRPNSANLELAWVQWVNFGLGKPPAYAAGWQTIRPSSYDIAQLS